MGPDITPAGDQRPIDVRPCPVELSREPPRPRAAGNPRAEGRLDLDAEPFAPRSPASQQNSSAAPFRSSSGRSVTCETDPYTLELHRKVRFSPISVSSSRSRAGA